MASDMPPAESKKLVWPSIELQTRLLASEDKPAPPAVPKPAPVTTSGGAHLDAGWLDPMFDRGATAKLFWKIKGREMEIPFRNPGELLEVLEFVYVVHGPSAVKQLQHQVELAIILLLARMEDLPDLLKSRDMRAVPEPVSLRTVRPSLYMRLNGGMGLVDLESMGRDYAWTDDITVQCFLPAYQKLLLQADDALTVALESLWKTTGEALRTLEETARGILAMTLDSARNEILREGLRYFRFERANSVEAALMSMKRPMAKAQDDARAEKAADVAKLPVHTLPKRLQEALKTLKPLAEDVIAKRKAVKEEANKAHPEETFQLIGVRDRRELSKREAAVREAVQRLAIETGKLREAHPVALRLSPEEMLRAADAARDVLGGILFPILAQAYQANKNVRSELQDWPLVVNKTGPWPESALIHHLKNNPGTSRIWRHRKYIERALSRVFPEPETVGHAAVKHVLAEMYPDSVWAKMAATMVRDTVLFHVAGKIDKRTALKAVETGIGKLPRLVPILNWSLAAASIYKQAIEYTEGEDFFFCTLDQRDALADVAPSALDLAGGITLEVAFALI